MSEIVAQLSDPIGWLIIARGRALGGRLSLQEPDRPAGHAPGRNDARWSNGDPSTASDFVFSFPRLLDPATAAPFASQFFAVRGAEAIAAGEQAADTLTVDARDAWTPIVALGRPTPTFLESLVHMPSLPVHAASSGSAFTSVTARNPSLGAAPPIRAISCAGVRDAATLVAGMLNRTSMAAPSFGLKSDLPGPARLGCDPCHSHGSDYRHRRGFIAQSRTETTPPGDRPVDLASCHFLSEVALPSRGRAHAGRSAWIARMPASAHALRRPGSWHPWGDPMGLTLTV